VAAGCFCSASVKFAFAALFFWLMLGLLAGGWVGRSVRRRGSVGALTALALGLKSGLIVPPAPLEPLAAALRVLLSGGAPANRLILSYCSRF